MAVRIKLKIKSKRGEVVTKALVNSGYESEEPEILVPVSIAKNLGLYPKLLAESSIESYRVAGGREEKFIFTRKAVEVKVITEDRTSPEVSCNLLISEMEDEVLISDKLSSKLRIVLLDIGEGLWCFRDELGKKTRKSE